MHLWLEGLNYSICLLYFCAFRQNKKYTTNRSFQCYGFNNKTMQNHMSGVAKNVRFFGSKLGQVANTKQTINWLQLNTLGTTLQRSERLLTIFPWEIVSTKYYHRFIIEIEFSCIEMGIVNIDLNNINLDNLMKMILILLFISDFGLGILNLKNTNLLKKDKWRINANSMASLKMVKFLHVRRWEKRNRNNFHCVMLLVYTNWEYWNFLPLQTFVNV